MKTKQKHIWYIWPRDSHTNEVLARLASNNSFGFEENTVRAECSDGVERNLWRIGSYEEAWFLWRSRADLKFRIFNQLRNGKIRDVTKPLFQGEKRSLKK